MTTLRFVPVSFAIVLSASRALAQAAPGPGTPPPPPAPGTPPPPPAPAAQAPYSSPYAAGQYAPPQGYAPVPYPYPYAPPPPPPPRPERDVSLTFSPLHLILPVVEVAAEFRAHKIMGVSVIGGVGSVKIDYGTPQPDLPSHAFVYELGGQLNAYPVGSFDHGMQLGLEAMYLHVSAGNPNVSGVASGLALGPYVGYKIITRGGFTFNGQLGAQYLAMKAEAQDSGGTQSTDSGKTTIVLLNLNIGWSF